MPIEIKELHIKVTVNAPGGSPTSAPKPSVDSSGKAAGKKETAIEDCVEQVLQILQNKKER